MAPSSPPPPVPTRPAVRLWIAAAGIAAIAATISGVSLLQLWPGLMTSGDPANTTDITLYDAAVRQWQDPDEAYALNATHFPPAIPAMADTPRFSCFAPKEGHAHLQLAVRMPPDWIAARLPQFTAQAKYVFSAGGGTIPGGMPAPECWTCTDDRGVAQSFPKHFKLFVLGATPHQDEPEPWYHGKSHGVAVSTLTPEIVFWTEAW